MGELKKTIIDRFKNLPLELRGRYIGEQGNERIEMPSGSIIYFSSGRSDDDIRKMLSGEFQCVHFDEWSEWPYSQWKFISGSVRTTTERDILGRKVIAQVKRRHESRRHLRRRFESPFRLRYREECADRRRP